MPYAAIFVTELIILIKVEIQEVSRPVRKIFTRREIKKNKSVFEIGTTPKFLLQAQREIFVIENQERPFWPIQSFTCKYQNRAEIWFGSNIFKTQQIKGFAINESRWLCRKHRLWTFWRDMAWRDMAFIIETITDSIPQIPPTSLLGDKEPINHQILTEILKIFLSG